MLRHVWLAKTFMVLPLCLFVLMPGHAHASSVAYTYDLVGRLATALYDNGLCIAYTFDANGNRLTLTGATSGATQSPYWGSGYWGCFNWTASGSATTPTWGTGVWGQAPWQAR